MNMLLLVITSRVASKFKNLGGWVTRNNTLLLVITGCVASKLKSLGGKIFEDSGEVN